MLILHGENTFQSREQLGKEIDSYKERGFTIQRLEMLKASLADLEQVMNSNSLFPEPTLTILEGLHSLKTSQRKKDLINKVASHPKSDTSQILLWESRSLTKTMLKPFGSAQVREFKTSKKLFSWLESVSPQRSSKQRQLKMLHEVLEQENEFLVLTMLARQVRMLIQVTDGEAVKAPPFVIKKLSSQARQFTVAQLLSLHNRLLEIDYQMKTSSSHLSVTQQLDLLVVQL